MVVVVQIGMVEVACTRRECKSSCDISTCTANSKTHGFAFSHLVPHSKPNQKLIKKGKNKTTPDVTTRPRGPQQTSLFPDSFVVFLHETLQLHADPQPYQGGPTSPSTTNRGPPRPMMAMAWAVPRPVRCFLFYVIYLFIYFLNWDLNFIIMRGELFFRGVLFPFTHGCCPLNAGSTTTLPLPVP